MQITVKRTNIEISSSLEKFAEEEIASLEKFISPKLIARSLQGKKALLRASLEIAKSPRYHSKDSMYYAELQINLPGKILRTESCNWNLKLAILDVRNKMQRKLKAYKEGLIARSKRRQRVLKRKLRFARGAMVPEEENG